MGNCFNSEDTSSTVMSRQAPYVAESQLDQEEEEGRLQHISDREDHDQHEIQILHNILPHSSATSPRLSRTSSTTDATSPGSLAASKKFNSTSTLFVDSTVSSLDHDSTIRCVALALHHIINYGVHQPNPNTYAERFDEKRFPLTDDVVRSDYMTHVPSDHEIFKFIHRLFHAAALTAECAIITLVYINRIAVYSDLTVHPQNWKRILLGSILMASKVWDDQAVWNVDFCGLLPRISVDEMNDLERTFLEMLDFNIDVDSSVYAKYYFELRGLAQRQQLDLAPLDKTRAMELEAMTVRTHETLKTEVIRNAKSLDGATFKAKAVLS